MAHIKIYYNLEILNSNICRKLISCLSSIDIVQRGIVPTDENMAYFNLSMCHSDITLLHGLVFHHILHHIAL